MGHYSSYKSLDRIRSFSSRLSRQTVKIFMPIGHFAAATRNIVMGSSQNLVSLTKKVWSPSSYWAMIVDRTQSFPISTGELIRQLVLFHPLIIQYDQYFSLLHLIYPAEFQNMTNTQAFSFQILLWIVCTGLTTWFVCTTPALSSNDWRALNISRSSTDFISGKYCSLI